MLAIRYIALAALVVWLSAMLGEFVRRSDVVVYGCGALLLVCLLIMKFVGPPPPAFIRRVTIVAIMLVVAVWSAALGDQSKAPIAVNLGLGMVLLFWYVRE